jgi:hypothetical protein
VTDAAATIPGYLGLANDLRSRIDALGENEIPTAWTPEHVGVRLIEAFEVLSRSGVRVGPGAYGNGWPAMVHEFADMVDAQARALAEKEKQQARAARPTADELSRMNEALAWPMAYLDGKPLQSDALMLWAYASATGRDMAGMLNHRKKRATAKAEAAARRANAAPHVDPEDGQVKDTRDPAVLAAYERRREIAREVAATVPAAEALAVLRARCRDADCLPLVVKPHEAMPGRVLSRTSLDRQRKVAAAAVAAELRQQGVAVR